MKAVSRYHKEARDEHPTPFGRRSLLIVILMRAFNFFIYFKTSETLYRWSL